MSTSPPSWSPPRPISTEDATPWGGTHSPSIGGRKSRMCSRPSCGQTWYAAYVSARRQGSTPEQASDVAALYMEGLRCFFCTDDYARLAALSARVYPSVLRHGTSSTRPTGQPGSRPRRMGGCQRCGVGASIIVGRAHSRSGPSQPLVPAWRHPAIPRAYRSGSRGSGLAGPGETASVAVDCGPVSRSLTFEECLVALERSARRLGGGLLCRARPAVAITTLLVVVDMLSTSWEPRAWAHSARRT